MSEQELPSTPNKEILAQELAEYGYEKNNRISQSELLLFLDRKSPDGKFDPTLSEKLFKTLNLNTTKTISIEKFINGFSEFEDEIKKNAEFTNNQYTLEKDIYDQIVEQCKKYESEKLNDEGFSENARLSGEIIEINLKTKIEGIKEIIIKIIHGDQEQEIIQKAGEEEDDNENKFFEFKASTKKENLEFILQAKNDSDDIITIGSKAYSLEGINTQDEFFVAIEIPENANEEEQNDDADENLAAEIKAKIALHWSNFKYFEFQRRKEEPKLKKLNTDVEKAQEYVKKLQDIYEGESRNSVYTPKKENSEYEESVKLTKQRLTKDSGFEEGFRNKKLFEFPVGKYIVEFNRERYDQIIRKGVEVDFNNTIQVTSPSKQHLSTEEGQNQSDEEQNEKEEDKEEEEKEKEKENEQNENEENEHEQESQHEEQVEQEENEQVEQNENELVEQNENELVEHHEDENIQLNENELVEQNENLNINQNDQQYNELLYSGNENLNIDTNQVQNENIDINNLNFGEYTQEANINSEPMEEYKDIIHDEQNYSYVNKAVISESTNKVLVQENTLPLKYLPEKVNKVIVDNNVGTLPLIIGRKSVTYDTGFSDTNNAFGISQVSQYNPTSLSYQIPNTINYQFGL